MYIRNDIDFQVREDLSLFHEGEFETIFIETTGPGRHAIIGEIYRVPGSNEIVSIDRFESILSKIHTDNSDLIIGTDQNFDLLKIDVHEKTSDLLNIFFSFDLIPTITKPTRITPTTATLIDNIYVRHDSPKIVSGIIPYNISDHFPVFCFTGHNLSIPKTRKPLIFKHRPISENKLIEIRNSLHLKDWSYLNDMEISEAYTDFIKTLNSTIDRYVPEEEVIIPAKHVIRDDWMTKGLMKSSYTVSKLYKKCSKKPKDDPAHQTYIQYRNMYNNLKRTAKKRYYEERFNQFKYDIKNTWKLLNKLIGQSKNRTPDAKTFKHNETNIEAPCDIANAFCSYFTNIGPNLANNMTTPDNNYNHYLRNKRRENPNSIFLFPTDANEIYKTIISLKPKKSSGYDNLNTKMLKNLEEELAFPLSLLINRSFSEGVVPDLLKIAKVIPVYKSKENDVLSNYRPISLLPSLSKVYEKVMYKRLYNFLETHNILYQSQYGFRKKHSTIHAVTEFVSNTTQALDNKQSTIAVFLDLSKAFDTIDHNILLTKLKFYGIRGIAHKWFTSYLSNTKQYVHYNTFNSDNMAITCGVPQGSVLGPLLFLIYVNDLADNLLTSKGMLFADDTTLYQSNLKLNDLYSDMSLELYNLSDWFLANKLSLNIAKSNFILFSKKRNIGNSFNTIKFGDVEIERKTVLKFLGMYIDENLTWAYHIKTCKCKIASSLYAINRIKHIIPESYLRTLYFSLVHPDLTYGLSLWGSTYKCT